MTDPHRDSSYSTSSSINPLDIALNNVDFESSLDSYSNFFNKAQHNFTTSSEISLINVDNEKFDTNPLSTDDHNRTFTKISRTIINAFTGKPISPNPWRKLCSKTIQHQIETDVTVPIHVFSPNSKINQDKIPQGQFSDTIATRQSQRDIINDQRVMDNINDEDDQAFEQSLQEHPVINRSIDNDSSWYRLADVYTSEESDENNHLVESNISYTIRLKSNINTSRHSSSPTSSNKIDTRSITAKDDTKTYLNFLESLSERVPIENKHPDAKSYFFQSGFNVKEKREELANKLLLIFNQDVFSSQLSDKVSVVWSGRLTATAGHCTTRRNTRTAVITLSRKVCDSPERCRDTLLHEMCHAAVTLIDGVMEHGHGPLWRQWTRTAEQSYPYLPSISVRHTYDVMYKFIYRCVQCEYEVYRHSKSLNPAVDFCGKCMNQFELIINNKDDAVKQERQTPKKIINKYNLYVKEHFQIMKQANPHLSTSQLMKQLSEEYKKKNQQQEQTDLPDLSQLKI